MKLKTEIVELFPTERLVNIYSGYHIDENEQLKSAGGFLYNHYKVLREKFRLAGAIDDGVIKNQIISMLEIQQTKKFLSPVL